jgi:hypothetical protein
VILLIRQEQGKRRRKMVKLSILLFTLLLFAGMGAEVALAQNVHFLKSGATLENDGDLSCTFRIAGLGDNESITVTCSADATAAYACFNKGGNHPQASNKESVSGPVSGSGDFHFRPKWTGEW